MHLSILSAIALKTHGRKRWPYSIALFLLLMLGPSYRLSAQLPESKKALLRIFNDPKEPDTLRLKAGTELQVAYSKSSMDSLLYISQRMEQFGIRKQNALWQGYAWRGYGTVHLLSGRLDSAKYAYLHAKSLYVKRDNPFYPRMLFSLGTLHFFQSNLDSAQYYYLKAIPWAESHTKLVSDIYLNLGTINQDLMQYTKALYYFEMAKRTATVDSKADMEYNISIIFESFGMFKEAEKHSREALRLAQSVNQPRALVSAYSSMILCAEANVTTFQHWIDEGLCFAQSAGMRVDYARILSTAGTRSLYYFKRLDLAEDYLKRAIEEAEKISDIGFLIRSKIALSFLKVQQKKYSQALQLIREVSPLMSNEMGLHSKAYFGVASDAFAGLGMIDSAYHYLKKLDFAVKNEQDIALNRSILLSYLEYQQKQEKEALAKEKAAAEALAKEVQKRQRTTVGIFALLSLFLVSIAAALYVFFRQRSHTTVQLSAQNAALQRSNERLRRFSGVVSHDILSNLDLLLSAGQILVGNQPKKESLTQYYDMAQRTSRKLKDYCLGLLEEARSAVGTAGRMSDPMPVLEAILAQQETVIMSKYCKVDLEPLSPSLLPESNTEQVFQNLISNALRYGMGAENPVLRIAEEKDPLRGTTRWVVEDNGAGIPLERRETIFQGTANPKDQSQGQHLG